MNEDANVILKNLPDALTSKDLKELGDSYGEVVSAVVKYDKNTGKTLGYGYFFFILKKYFYNLFFFKNSYNNFKRYIQFHISEEAQKFIQNFGGAELDGKQIEVQLFQSKAKRGIKGRNNLYVKNFPHSWSEEQVNTFINEEFGKNGEITSVAVKYSEKNKNYFAFVCFKEAETAKNTISELNGKDLEGNHLYVNYAQSQQARKRMWQKTFSEENKTNIYIKGIKEYVDEAMISKAFSGFGEITNINLKKKDLRIGTGFVPSGFAFVNFKHPEDARKVLNDGKLNEAIRDLVDFDLIRDDEYLTLAQNKEERKEYLRRYQ